MQGAADFGKASLEQRGRSQPQPFYFVGPRERPLLGCIHWPQGEWSGARIVLCPPLGYEGLFSHLTMHETAAQLAARTNAVVMRFDYDGTGDSAGTDEDADRVEAWLQSIHHAIDHLKTESGDGSVILLGLRAGALLAAHAAATRSDVEALALWAPCASGKSFLREQRALALLNPHGANEPPSAAAAAGGVESNGFVFTAAAVRELETMSLKSVPRLPAPNVLVLQRADLPTSGVLPKGLESSCNLEEATISDYQTMMDPPWLWRAPAQAIDILCDWASRLSSGNKPRGLDAPKRVPRSSALVERGVEETVVTFGKGSGRFGILTTPAGKVSTHAVLLVTSTFGYRIGPNRVNVALARRLARDGLATLRIDVGGVGDSRDSIGVSPPGPYERASIDDVCDASKLLSSRGYTRQSISGVCAGAFLAWTAAERIEAPVQLVLVNVETFDTIEYDREHLTTFQNPRPPFRTRLEAAPTLLEKAKVALPVLARGAGIGLRSVRASAPSWLLPETLGARVARVIKRGSRLDLVFSHGDMGLRHYRLGAALHHLLLARRGLISIQVIHGPDHSFTSRWSSNRLVDDLTRTFGAWSRGPRAIPTAQPLRQTA